MFYLFFAYRSESTDADDRVYDCLNIAIGEIQSVDPKSAFCFKCETSIAIIRSGWDLVLPMPMGRPPLILPH